KVHPDYVRQQQVYRLTEHRRFGLDTADAPADNAEPVDHRCVRIGADERIRIEHALLFQHTARQELEIHLMTDAETWRHDAHVLECLHAPLEKAVPFVVAPELHFHVEP